MPEVQTPSEMPTEAITSSISPTPKKHDLRRRKVIIVGLLAVIILILSSSAAFVLNQLGQKQNNPDLNETSTPEPIPAAQEASTLDELRQNYPIASLVDGDIYLYAVTGESQQLTNIGNIATFVFSADGRYLAYATSDPVRIRAKIAEIPENYQYSDANGNLIMGGIIDRAVFTENIGVDLWMRDLEQDETSLLYSSDLSHIPTAVDKTISYVAGAPQLFWADLAVRPLEFTPDNKYVVFQEDKIKLANTEIPQVTLAETQADLCYGLFQTVWLGDNLIGMETCWETSDARIFTYADGSLIESHTDVADEIINRNGVSTYIVKFGDQLFVPQVHYGYGDIEATSTTRIYAVGFELIDTNDTDVLSLETTSPLVQQGTRQGLGFPAFVRLELGTDINRIQILNISAIGEPPLTYEPVLAVGQNLTYISDFSNSYVLLEATGEGTGNFDLYVYDLSTGKLQKLRSDLSTLSAKEGKTVFWTTVQR
jgi:hypothetical protein